MKKRAAHGAALRFATSCTTTVQDINDLSPACPVPCGPASFVQVEPSSSISISNPGRPHISWARLLLPGSLGRDRSSGHRPGSARIRPAKADPVITPKRRRRSRKARVQLALVEEHRCPYCLETVTRTTPHVECTICQTLHHKDCWDITGTCQVPHLNN